MRSGSWAVDCCSRPLRDQLFGDLGSAFQPGQPRLLVHPGQLLACGQALAHDRDELAVGGRFLFQGPGGEQLQTGPSSARVITGYGPKPWPRAAWQSAHISTVNRPSTLAKGPVVAPQNKQ
jgi:hypothetical protein